MTIPALGAITSALSAIGPAASGAGAVGVDPSFATAGVNGAGAGAGAGTSFAQELSNGLDKLQQVQAKSDDLAVKAATGDLTDVHDYMIASSEASLATQLTVAVRNKALDAFGEIMRMQA